MLKLAEPEVNITILFAHKNPDSPHIHIHPHTATGTNATWIGLTLMAGYGKPKQSSWPVLWLR